MIDARLQARYRGTLYSPLPVRRVVVWPTGAGEAHARRHRQEQPEDGARRHEGKYPESFASFKGSNRFFLLLNVFIYLKDGNQRYHSVSTCSCQFLQ